MYIILGLIVLIGGLVVFAVPEVAWYLKEGWKFRDAEPSDIALVMNKFGGVVGALIGIGMMIYGGTELMQGNELWAVLKVDDIDSVRVTSTSFEAIFLSEEEIKEMIRIIRKSYPSKISEGAFGGAYSESMGKSSASIDKSSESTGESSISIADVRIEFKNRRDLVLRSYNDVFVAEFDGARYTFNGEELESYLEACF